MGDRSYRLQFEYQEAVGVRDAIQAKLGEALQKCDDLLEQIDRLDERNNTEATANPPLYQATAEHPTAVESSPSSSVLSTGASSSSSFDVQVLQEDDSANPIIAALLRGLAVPLSPDTVWGHENGPLEAATDTVSNGLVNGEDAQEPSLQNVDEPQERRGDATQATSSRDGATSGRGSSEAGETPAAGAATAATAGGSLDSEPDTRNKETGAIRRGPGASDGQDGHGSSTGPATTTAATATTAEEDRRTPTATFFTSCIIDSDEAGTTQCLADDGTARAKRPRYDAAAKKWCWTRQESSSSSSSIPSSSPRMGDPNIWSQHADPASWGSWSDFVSSTLPSGSEMGDFFDASSSAADGSSTSDSGELPTLIKNLELLPTTDDEFVAWEDIDVQQLPDNIDTAGSSGNAAATTDTNTFGVRCSSSGGGESEASRNAAREPRLQEVALPGAAQSEEAPGLLGGFVGGRVGPHPRGRSATKASASARSRRPEATMKMPPAAQSLRRIFDRREGRLEACGTYCWDLISSFDLVDLPVFKPVDVPHFLDFKRALTDASWRERRIFCERREGISTSNPYLPAITRIERFRDQPSFLREGKFNRQPMLEGEEKT